uniref:Ig-like domain-containing protein n=1 Tax=Meloidogyne hapla TaxID=6305 RepID=A0A1I8BGV7_MELHA
HIISNTAICPLKCFCNEGGAFPTQFSSSLQNLSILNSEIESMGIFPRMEKLLILNLRGNNLEHIGSNGKSLRRDASGETIRSLFPSLISLDLSENKITTINEHMLRDSPAIEVLDLSQNQLSVAQSSSFFAAQKLKSLNLSHNRLHRFDYDSFSPLFQNLDISNCKNLRLIEQRSFSFTPVLQFLKLANNSQLQYISPYAFQNSLLYELVISNNSLETIDNKILEQPTRLFISGNPFDCSCAEETFTNYAQKIVDLKEATCKARKGISQNSTSTLPLTTIIKSSNKLNQECSNKPLILPFGNYLNASVGEYFSLYCAPRRTSDKTFLYWKLPNGTTVQSDDQIKDTVVFNIPTIIQSFTKDGRTSTWIPFHKQRQRNPRLDTESHSKSLTNIHNHQHQRERVQVTGEQLRFEVIMLEDAGEYICSVDGVEAKLHLSVHAPSIQLKPVEIGSHYVALVWNDSLKIRALERVQLSLRIRDAVTGQTGRITQLSLYNPWHSYNVVRLRPLTVS